MDRHLETDTNRRIDKSHAGLNRRQQVRKSSAWNRIFGNASPKSVFLRFSLDFLGANLMLIVAAILRLALTGRIGMENPLGVLLGKITTLYWINVGWFTVTALVLFIVNGVYRPVPSSQVGKRLVNVARACAIGFISHIGLGLYLGNSMPTVEVAVPAWGMLYLWVAGSRFSRMYIGSKYRMVRRSETVQEKMEDVLVVGGAGYIGSVLTRQLLDAGYRVRVLDLEMFGIDSVSEILHHPRLEVMRGDFRNVEDVVRALRGMDAVVHLAAIVGDPACALDKNTTIAVNYAAAKMMAQLARANGISRFVFASTCSVYGASDDIRDEFSDLNPVSLYATTKIDAERALIEATDDFFQPTILRFATAYGWSHRPRFDLVANLFSAQAVTDGRIRIFNGEQWRPFVHTRDIARACVMTLEAPLAAVGGEIFNVGDDSQNYTLRQLGEIVGNAHPGTVVEEITNEEDPRNYRVNFDKIRDILGYRASVTLEDGIQEMVDAVLSGEVADWHDPIYSNIRHLEGEGLSVLKFDANAEEDRDAGMPTTREFLARAA